MQSNRLCARGKRVDVRVAMTTNGVIKRLCLLFMCCRLHRGGYVFTLVCFSHRLCICRRVHAKKWLNLFAPNQQQSHFANPLNWEKDHFCFISEDIMFLGEMNQTYLWCCVCTVLLQIWCRRVELFGHSSLGYNIITFAAQGSSSMTTGPPRLKMLFVFIVLRLWS